MKKRGSKAKTKVSKVFMEKLEKLQSHIFHLLKEKGIVLKGISRENNEKVFKGEEIHSLLS